MKKSIALLLLAVMLLTPFSTSCASSAAAQEIMVSLSDNGITVDGKPASTDSEEAVYIGNDIIYYESGHDSSYGEGTASDEHSAEEAAAHTVVTITQPGTYRLSGKLSAGQIFVDLGENADRDANAVVTLIMDGVDITCTVAPAVFFHRVYESADATVDTKGVVDTSASGANVILADDSDNTVNGSYVARIYKEGTTKKLHKYDGAFYSRMSMNMNGGDKGNGILRIQAENEGLNSELHLTLNGGNIYIESQDDAINTNEDGISVTTINGGTLSINAGLGSEGDGIDSNGYLTINGGKIVTLANGRTGDGGIDADSDITINGGTVIALGSRNDATSSNSKQAYMELSFASTRAAGSTIVIKDSTGDEVFNYVTEKLYQSATFSSPELKIGETYSVYVDGIQQQYTGNQFGMMGGGGGPRPNGQGGQDGQPPELPEGVDPPQTGERPELPEGFDPSQMGERPEPPEGFDPSQMGERPELPEGFDPSQMGERPELPEGFDPGQVGNMPGDMGGQGAANAEGSVAFTLTDTVKSFSGVSDAVAASGKTKVTFAVNNGKGINSVTSGNTVTITSIKPSEDVPASDVQITITDDPSESYSESVMLSEGMDALKKILPEEDGNYVMTIAVLSSNETYTGVTQLRFSIGVLPFTDVKRNDSHYDAIKYVYDAGIMNGTSDTTFSGSSSVSRSMAITTLARMASAKAADTNSFTDVVNGSWYSAYVGWAVSNGIVEGDGVGHFYPHNAVTSAHMELMLTRYAATIGVEYEATNTSTKALTRAELADMLMKFSKSL